MEGLITRRRNFAYAGFASSAYDRDAPKRVVDKLKSLLQESATRTTQRDTSNSPLALARGFEGPRWLNRFNGLLLRPLPRLIAVQLGRCQLWRPFISRTEGETVENGLG